MINQTDLKYFVELSKTLHVSRAAERLGVTQPTLSHCLKRLEEETKTPLFIRSKKGLTLTSAGERLAEQALSLIEKWNDVFKSTQDEVHRASGTVRFGCHSAVAQYTLPRFTGDFLKAYPEITLQLTHGLSRHMAEAVISDKLDAAFVVNPINHPDLIIKEISMDKVTLWKIKNCINPDVLIVEPSLLQSQDLIRKFSRKGIKFKRVIESQSLEVISQLVASGAGCGILPERVIRAVSSEQIQQVKDAPEIQDRMCLVYKAPFRKLKRGAALIEFVIEALR